MWLLEIKAHELAIFLVSCSIKGPVDGPVASNGFGIVSQSNTGGGLVKHVGMEEEALLVIPTNLSETVDQVSVVRTGVIESGPHEII